MDKQLEMAKMISTIKENMPALLAKARLDAELHMNKYKALTQAGFNESQALELCKQIY